MDIKLKKFDGSMSKKAIVFVFAILIAASAVIAPVYAFHEAYDKVGEASYVEDYFLNGVNPEIYEHQEFYDDYSSFLNSAMTKVFLYGGKSTQSYNDYLSRKKSIKAKQDSTIKKYFSDKLSNQALMIVDDDWTYSSCEIYVAYTKELISLKLLKSLDRQSYEKNISEDAENIDDLYDYEDTFDADLTVTNDVISNRIEIPENVLSMAQNENADGVVKIMSVINGKALFGYYAFTVNTEKAYNYFTDRGFVYNCYEEESEKEYNDEINKNEKELQKYKNIFFAFVNNSTGDVISNMDGIKSNSNAEEIENAFLADNGDGTFYGTFDNAQVNIEKCGNSFKESDKFLYGIVPTESIYGGTLAGLSDDYSVYIKLDKNCSHGSDVFSNINENYYIVAKAMNIFVIVDSVLLILFILCIVYLVAKSGKNETDDELHMMRGDRLFTDFKFYINGGIIAGLVCALVALCIGILNINPILFTAVSALLVLLIATVLIDLILYCARHIKNRDFLKNLFPVWLVLTILKELKKDIQRNRESFVYLKDFRKAILKKLLLMVALPNIVVIFFTLILSQVSPFGLVVMFLLFVYDVFVLIYAIKLISGVKTILVAINQIRSGNYNIYINIPDLPKELRASAQNILQLRDGMKIAVDKAVADDKMKTELITNVSHDLKTPLTSIINYVDLLSRLDIQDETAKEYLEVLGEKSARLKRLIEDLVEVSKATSGAINVNFMKVSLNELISQLAGEYEDEFEAYGISAVTNIPDESVCVNADSKLIYRVVDNLLSNVKKYSMENSRVYIDVLKSDNKGIIRIKNISREPLNISPEKLKERFVRGDLSRTREGSGLGLSIAENLCNLQNGRLILDINGDMFISTIEFELFREPTQSVPNYAEPEDMGTAQPQ